jgi:hypothetical protein
MGETAKLEQCKQQVNIATSKLVGNVIALLQQRFGYADGAPSRWAGEIKRAINIRWAKHERPHDHMMADDFIAKYRWLQGVNNQMLLGEVPQWLYPESLRMAVC